MEISKRVWSQRIKITSKERRQKNIISTREDLTPSQTTTPEDRKDEIPCEATLCKDSETHDQVMMVARKGR